MPTLTFDLVLRQRLTPTSRGVVLGVEPPLRSVATDDRTPILAPLLGVAARAEAHGRFLGRLEVAKVVEQVLNESAERAGAAHYDLLAQVREAIAAECRRRFGARDDVVGGKEG